MTARRTLLCIVMTAPLLAAAPAPPPVATDPLGTITLPPGWREQFWASEDAKALLALDSKAIAALVPEQAGLRYCRCPSCPATETDDPMQWSLATKDLLKCKACGATFPNDTIPAKKDNKIPEERVEIRSGQFHLYPYHLVPPESQRYPDERIYLAAKRDYEAREWLAKAALYAAMNARELGPGPEARPYARLGCALLIRFARVYPNYATHYDQPEEPKFFLPADLPPPYRAEYKTAKWDWTASLNVPLNLAIAYAILRDDPMMAEVARTLDVADPRRCIERDLFRASADFVALQPQGEGESALLAARGILAVGRLLNDADLMRAGVAQLSVLSARSFSHDGRWTRGDDESHRRVVMLLDGWIDRLLTGYSSRSGPLVNVPGIAIIPRLALARMAGSATIAERKPAEVLQATWPAPVERALPRGAILLGGAGIARLAVGEGPDALDLELRGLADLGTTRSQRLSLRVAVGGVKVIDDFEDAGPRRDGWDRSTASGNTVLIDGLNQRETPDLARQPSSASDIAFFAATPDLQVAAFEDRSAYPRAASLYRRTIVAVSDAENRYAVSLFEIEGGLQHEEVYHGAAGQPSVWKLASPTAAGPRSLLPSSITFLPGAKAEDGRWFVQSMGRFQDLRQAVLRGPTNATLGAAGDRSLRLHLLGDPPGILYSGSTPEAEKSAERAALILRRRSEDGTTLKSHLVTLFEPLNSRLGPRRFGRVQTASGVVLTIRSDRGDETLFINTEPGTTQEVTLADGSVLQSDARVVRISQGVITMAGGTTATLNDQTIARVLVSGEIISSSVALASVSHGWFDTSAAIDPGTVVPGQILRIHLPDGTRQGWTIHRVEAGPSAGSRIWVREDPGFLVLAKDQTPSSGRNTPQIPGPLSFQIDGIGRSTNLLAR